MAKWSEILPQETLCLATELEAHAQEERDNGKVLYPPQEQNLLKDLISCAAVYEDGGHIVKENLIKKAYVLSSHPSPFSATRPCRGTPAFRGSKPFSTANKLLTDMGGTPIDWSL